MQMWEMMEYYITGLGLHCQAKSRFAGFFLLSAFIHHF